MNYSTTVEKVSENELEMVQYRYYALQELEMVLSSIVYFNRPSKRHKWSRVKGWDRLSSRNSDMPREEPPDDVKAEVRRRMNEAITFK